MLPPSKFHYANVPRKSLLRPLSSIAWCRVTKLLPRFRYWNWVVLGLLLLTAAMLAYFAVDDGDIWWHLASGQQIWNTGAVPRVEPFSYLSAGRPWLDEYWLYQLGLLAVWKLGGPAAFAAAKSAYVAL